MAKIISATQARIHFGAVMREVAETNEPYVVEKAGVPQVAIVPTPFLEEIEAELTRERRTRAIDETVAQAAALRRHKEGLTFTPAEDIIREMRDTHDAGLR